MKRKYINRKKIRKSKGNNPISGNCFFKSIDHFKFRDLRLDNFTVVRINKMSDSIYAAKLSMTMKGDNKTKKEQRKWIPFSEDQALESLAK